MPAASAQAQPGRYAHQVLEPCVVRLPAPSETMRSALVAGSTDAAELKHLLVSTLVQTTTGCLATLAEACSCGLGLPSPLP